jgi:Cu/Ag efflux protein CusF
LAEHIKIADVTPRIQHTATGNQTLFEYPFPIFKAADLEVYLDDVKQASGYEVHDAGNSSGGTLTFDSPPAGGTIVTLHRLISIERTTDFLRSAPLTANAINDDLDYLTVAVQQVADDAERSLHLNVTDEGANLVLPAKAERADKLLAFDADGNVTARSEGGGITDHGALTGLGDDDHPQYHTDARADSWLTSKTLDDIDAGVANRHFTTTDQAKLAGVEDGATADMSGAEIKAAYEAEADTHAFTDGDQAKLDGIEDGAQVNTVTTVLGRTGSIAAEAGDAGFTFQVQHLS